MLRISRPIFCLITGCGYFVGAWAANTPLQAEDQLAAVLARPITAAWQGQELAAVLARITATHQLEIWLDRRVDPQQTIDVQFQDLPLGEALDKLTEPRSLGWSEFDELIYIGPAESARDLPTLAEIARNSLAKISPKDRKPWLEKSAATWPRLSEPRRLFMDWLAAEGIELVNPDAIPHDLWNAKHLPKLSLIDRVLLLLVGFDKTCRVSAEGKSCRIVPIERPVLMTREYRPGNHMRELVKQLQDIPGVSVNRHGDQLAVTGRWEDHERVAQLLGGSSSRQKGRPQPTQRTIAQVFSLRLENQPVAKVIHQLAAQLGLEVSWSSALGDEQRNALVSCDVINGDLSTLLGAILSPAGLTFELQGKRLEIAPAN